MPMTLYEKAMLCEAMLEERHTYEGQIRALVVLPPIGLPDYSTGNHESDALSTGMYLATQAFRWAATKDPKAKERARTAARALRMLQRVTRTDGCFARGFKRGNGATWDEQAFFFPREWHQAGEYRWLGDPSTDSLVGLMFGYELYCDLVADAKEKRQIAKDVDLVMRRIVDQGMRIVDVDGRMTLWGNMSPLVLEENLNALQALSHLRGAYHITKKRGYLREYRRLIQEWGYHKIAARANTETNPEPSEWDYNLAMCPLYTLLCYETDPGLLRYYYRALQAQWRGSRARHMHDALFNWTYKAFHPRAPIAKETWEWLHSFEVSDFDYTLARRPATRERAKRPYLHEVPKYSSSVQAFPASLLGLPGKERMVEVVLEGVPRYFLRAYWAGRYFGCIPPEA